MEVLKVIAVGKIKKGDAVAEVKEKTIFQVGDIVDWCGAKGEVIKHVNSCDDSITVKIGKRDHFTFLNDGRILNIHKRPALILIERPKKFVVFKDWEIGTKYKCEDIKCSYIKLRGLPFRLDTHSFSSNSVKYFIDNKFYKAE